MDPKSQAFLDRVNECYAYLGQCSDMPTPNRVMFSMVLGALDVLVGIVRGGEGAPGGPEAPG